MDHVRQKVAKMRKKTSFMQVKCEKKYIMVACNYQSMGTSKEAILTVEEAII